MAQSRRGSSANMFSTAKTNLKAGQTKVVNDVIEESKEEKPVVVTDQVPPEPKTEEDKAEPKGKEESDNPKTPKAKEEPPKTVKKEKAEKPQKTVKEEKAKKPEAPSKTASLFTANPKKERGIQKSIYLKKEVYDQLTAITKQYNLPLSEVINTLLEESLK